MENKPQSEIITSDKAFAPQIYISAKVGEETEPFKVKAIKRVTSESSKMCLSGTNHRIEVVSIEDKILTVTSWPLHNEFQRVVKQHGAIENKTIKVIHPEAGKYEVVVIDTPTTGQKVEASIAA